MPASRLILTGGRLHAPDHPGASALVVEGDRIRYLGDDDGARAAAPEATERRLGGRLVTPAFVDAHVHTVQTGQLLGGIDLHGAASRSEVLDRVAAYARVRPGAQALLGQGWDETGWADPRPPTRSELDRAAGDVPLYLARVDVHSALISTALLASVPELPALPGYREDGWLTREAHHGARDGVNRLSSDDERRAAIRTALAEAAALGVAAVHEMGGPHLGPLADLRRVREVAGEIGIDAVAYWGELATPQVLGALRTHGGFGLAGDLCVDGALGSHTAALRSPYADAASTGVRYLNEEEIAEHLVACTRAGVQAGFHCIGDDAVAAAVDGLRQAARVLGVTRVRAARHRLEHLEMPAGEHAAVLADLGVTVSGQPAFDAAWGGPGGLYARRLGPERSQTMNPWSTLDRAGVRLAFGTDAPVTPLAGWATVRAALHAHEPSARIGPDAAFAAATVGPWRAVFDDAAGVLQEGQRASIAVWEVATDQEWGGSGLPRLDPGQALPRCVATFASGRLIFDALGPG